MGAHGPGARPACVLVRLQGTGVSVLSAVWCRLCGTIRLIVYFVHRPAVPRTGMHGHDVTLVTAPWDRWRSRLEVARLPMEMTLQTHERHHVQIISMLAGRFLHVCTAVPRRWACMRAAFTCTPLSLFRVYVRVDAGGPVPLLTNVRMRCWSQL